MDIFTADFKELLKIQVLYKNAPKQMAKVTANIINEQAFDMKKSYLPESINKLMEVRNKGFMNSSLRVVKSAPRTDINKQIAEVGSIYRERFSGWEEQQLNVKTKRTRTPTLASRGNDFKKTMQQSKRLKNANKVHKFGEIKAKSIAQWMQILNNQHKNELFEIKPAYKNMKEGIYFINTKGKIRKAQSLTGENVQPKHKPWMLNAIGALRNTFNINQSFRKHFKTIFGINL